MMESERMRDALSQFSFPEREVRETRGIRRNLYYQSFLARWAWFEMVDTKTSHSATSLTKLFIEKNSDSSVLQRKRAGQVSGAAILHEEIADAFTLLYHGGWAEIDLSYHETTVREVQRGRKVKTTETIITHHRPGYAKTEAYGEERMFKGILEPIAPPLLSEPKTQREEDSDEESDDNG